MAMPVEAVPDDELLSIIGEVEKGQGRIKHLAPVAKAVLADRWRVEKSLKLLETGQQDLHERLEQTRTEMRAGFEAVNQRFDTIDRRFEVIDQRFEVIDQRFEAIDQRFEAIDRRFDAMDQRFDTMDQRFDAMDQRFTDMATTIENVMTRQLETFSARVLDGVKAQLEEHGVPISDAERRGYRK